jgi:hypothetical protein
MANKKAGKYFCSLFVGRTGLEPVTTETNTATSIPLKFSLLIFLFLSFFHGFAPFLRRFFKGIIMIYIFVNQFVVIVRADFRDYSKTWNAQYPSLIP